MFRSWRGQLMIYLIVALIGIGAAVLIAGRPHSVDDIVIPSTTTTQPTGTTDAGS